ncbi:MAG: sigma-70 family RNA polymerase sigma factor [Planctomycetes bacterium]|nr:sigma-70 family RNA polymerase sigma factor [Planctomycetota bacterium]
MHSNAPTNHTNLLDRALQGDEGVRGALLETYRNYLELLARIEIGRRLQTKVDAADLVQETFLEAHRNFGLFRGRSEGEFINWLRGIMATRIATMVRHFVGTQGRDVHRERELDVNLDHSSRALDRGLVALQSSPSQNMQRHELQLMFADILAKLPADYREVIVLRHFEEMPVADVAARMNRSVDSVQKLWVRGLTKLRQLVEEAHGRQ